MNCPGTAATDRCHCGALIEEFGSDHCRICFCEHYEATCEHRATAEELEEQALILAG
jgi:hypothetical protein